MGNLKVLNVSGEGMQASGMWDIWINWTEKLIKSLPLSLIELNIWNQLSWLKGDKNIDSIKYALWRLTKIQFFSLMMYVDFEKNKLDTIFEIIKHIPTIKIIFIEDFIFWTSETPWTKEQMKKYITSWLPNSNIIFEG
jgi:hypothetical protein